MTKTFEPADLTLRLAGPADLAAVDALLARSYPRLLAADYPPSVMVTAVPILARANPALLASGNYWLIWQGAWLIAAGGLSLREQGAATKPGAPRRLRAHVRHLSTDPAAVRRGVGRMLMEHVLDRARAAGATEIEAMSTLTAVPFYTALGFEALGEQVIPLAPGIDFTAMRMLRDL